MASDLWLPYNGNYVKKVYDIKLKDGSVIEGCWPNAGSFMKLNSSKQYAGDKVEFVRASKKNYEEGLK